MLQLTLYQTGLIGPGHFDLEIGRNAADEFLGHGVGAPVVGVLRIDGL